VTVLVVEGPLLLVAQDLIGLAQLLELLLGLLVPLVLVGVVLDRELAVGLLDLLGCGGPLDLENRVVAFADALA